MLTVSVVLLIVFSTYFPGFSYRDEWKKSTLIIITRDILITLDRTSNLYAVSFNDIDFENFLNKLPLSKKIVWWKRTNNLVPTYITVACNCSKEEKALLSSWFNNLRINGRNVSIGFSLSKLDKINTPSQLLLIIGYKNLTPYKKEIEAYLSSGKGIIELADLTEVDDETKKIFGIDICSNILNNCNIGGENNISFVKPTNAVDENYQIWKLFYHFPLVLATNNINLSVPTEGNIQLCSQNGVYYGNFSIRKDKFLYWICNDSLGYRVYWDTNKNSKADTIVYPREYFYLDGFKFLLSYAIDNSTIAVTFKPEYNFTDFLSSNRLYPIDFNEKRIVLKKGNYSGTNYPVPASVVNTNGVYRSVWIANFARNGLANITDAEKAFLEAAILYAADKNQKVFIPSRMGYEVPYINVVNSTPYDMYEVYAFYLGVSYPY